VLVQELPSLENGGISQDGRVITLKLRDDITWSDGQPITAQDFVFTYEMITDPNNGVTVVTPYDQVESVTAPDERTVVVTFNQPYAPWLSAFSRACCVYYRRFSIRRHDPTQIEHHPP
jgi:peptide/nickel transport system substrate-binding protein